MTKLKYWYMTRMVAEKQAFITYMADSCGVDETTVYRYLNNEAPKLTKHLISDYTKIPVEYLYKTVIA